MKKRLLFLLIIIATIVCLFSCGKKSYIVSFDPNGTDMETDRIKVEYGEYYMLPEPYRLGYGFLGWYNGAEKVESSGIWQIEGDTQLVAKWEFLEFTITCDVNGDGEADRNYGYNSTSKEFSIEDPVEKGKIFSHWIDENGKTYNSNLTIPSGSEGSYNLTAVWWNYVYNDVLYEYNGETLCVAGYIGNLQTDIFIPSEIFGKTVIGIKAGAFDGLEKKAIPYGYISRIIIPRTISYIGENAFNDCKNIRVTLQINYDDEATLEVISWLQSVEISPIGNDDLVDVLTFKRPAIGFSQYEDIVE